MTSEKKREELLRLAKQRQADRREGYLCLSGVHAGYYECDLVSPWSTSAQNVDAELMILGKDWVSSETIADRPPDPERRRIGQGWDVPTNKNLREYLSDCVDGLVFSETYASNVFPFIKHGKKNSSIRNADMLYAAKKYALPQIDFASDGNLSRPACISGCSTRCHVARIAWTEAISPRPHTRISAAEVYGVWHPSMYPGGKTAVKLVWTQIGDRLKELQKN